MLDFNEYQKKAHETASYPEGTIVDTKEDLQHYVSYIYPALGLAKVDELKSKNENLFQRNTILVNQLAKAMKHLRDLVYVVELGKNELATARILAEAKEFLKEE